MWYNENFPKPGMTQNEFQFMISQLEPEDNFLEYGPGFSTINIAPKVKKLVAIEHIQDWKVKIEEMCVEAGVDNVEVNLVPLDLPRIAPPDWRKNPAAFFGFPTPVECVMTHVNWVKTQDTKWDKVLIDGRGRQWVATNLIGKLQPNAKVFIHDYIYRERYFMVEKYYNRVKTVDSLAMFQLKPEWQEGNFTVYDYKHGKR